MAADYEDALSERQRVPPFRGGVRCGCCAMRRGPRCAARRKLRAEIFAAQLRAYLRREFDEEWWRSNRAARFIVRELWRPGRRHSAEELLGFMGYEGFDAGILCGRVRGGAERPMTGLTHLDESGRARMVDVSDKDVTRREATARASGDACSPRRRA